MRDNVFKENNNGWFTGHFGHDKTYGKLSSSYYWMGMRYYVNNFVEKCKIFQCDKGK
jgi:hypothetical protein